MRKAGYSVLVWEAKTEWREPVGARSRNSKKLESKRLWARTLSLVLSIVCQLVAGRAISESDLRCSIGLA